MSGAGQPAIQISGLYFAYDRVPILEAVDLRIEELDSLCIVGPNGGGKTTLLKLILGLLEPDRGQVLVRGRQPAEMRLHLGYVPQYSHYDPLFPVTVLDVILMGRLGRRLGGFYRAADRRVARDSLALVGLSHLEHRVFSAISGGQRQRVLIARALACEAEILLLDEPTANIDMETENQLFNLLRELNRTRTIVVVTHDVGFASSFFQRIACVNRRVATHPVAELDGRMIHELYGSDVALIRHDHHCGKKGSDCGV
ncbi:MAG TPA: ABC transporter ATP-binding protein [Desulfurivibrio alkaliphilus]|uniref:ABC transporter ATP-binding protein n=1 Tax=Desulfurivibrio alkaliphilus TaxID=427923 RepID=A0A7C2X8U1_9BACT|nr:ABC transporter ATP-binding protein [Desulfurivibrio alkaliphilus]